MPPLSRPWTVPFQRPLLPPLGDALKYYEVSERERWYSNSGPCVALLTQRLEDCAGRRVTPTANGTLALIAAIAATLRARPRKGTTALVPSFTFPATAGACEWAGVTPVFVDIDSRSWHMADDALARALAERHADVAVVVAVSAFGTPPPRGQALKWAEECQRWGVPLVVDSAAAFGAAGRLGGDVESLGDVEVFSMHATKPIGIGEGGFIATANDEIHHHASQIINFGFNADRELVEPMALNAKLAELPAAMALAALDRSTETLEARRRLAQRMAGRLEPSVSFQEGSAKSTWQFVPVLTANQSARERARNACIGASIECRVYYEPLHMTPAFRQHARADTLAATEDVYGRILGLPLAPDMSDEVVDVVAETVLAGLDGG
jgi:dTDP-4-amino-4,6-dideoxygalactose transaminase